MASALEALYVVLGLGSVESDSEDMIAQGAQANMTFNTS